MSSETYVFQRVSPSFREEKDYTWENQDQIHGGEERISSPADTVKHGSSDHDLMINYGARLTREALNLRRKSSKANWMPWRERWQEPESVGV